MERYVFLIGRILLGVLFLMAGVGKFMRGLGGFGEFIASQGFPAALAAPVAIFEIVAGLMIIAGFFTRWAAYALAAFCVFTALVYHPGEMSAILKNLALAGAFLMLSAAGPGAISADSRRLAG